jgi:hypothetical protein
MKQKLRQRSSRRRAEAAGAAPKAGAATVRRARRALLPPAPLAHCLLLLLAAAVAAPGRAAAQDVQASLASQQASAVRQYAWTAGAAPSPQDLKVTGDAVGTVAYTLTFTRALTSATLTVRARRGWRRSCVWGAPLPRAVPAAALFSTTARPPAAARPFLIRPGPAAPPGPRRAPARRQISGIVEFTNRGTADATVRSGSILLCLSAPAAGGTPAAPAPQLPVGAPLTPGSCGGATYAGLQLTGGVRAPAGGRALAQFSGTVTVNFPPEGAIAVGYVDAFDDRGQRVVSLPQQFKFTVNQGGVNAAARGVAGAPKSAPQRLPSAAARRSQQARVSAARWGRPTAACAAEPPASWLRGHQPLPAADEPALAPHLSPSAPATDSGSYDNGASATAWVMGAVGRAASSRALRAVTCRAAGRMARQPPFWRGSRPSPRRSRLRVAPAPRSSLPRAHALGAPRPGPPRPATGLTPFRTRRRTPGPGSTPLPYLGRCPSRAPS